MAAARPRAALVLWQAVALAAVLSAFSAGIATASRLLMPGPDGRPTSTIAGDIGRLGWPLWLLYVGVLTATVLIGVRFLLAVLQVMISTRRRRARHRMLVDLLGTNSPPRRAIRRCGCSTFTPRWPTACPAGTAASCSARAR